MIPPFKPHSFCITKRARCIWVTWRAVINGVPPLRWNRQLTHAARWFSWDSPRTAHQAFAAIRIRKDTGQIIAHGLWLPGSCRR